MWKTLKFGGEIFLSLLLGVSLVSAASSSSSLSKYCLKSMNDSSTSGIFPHPTRCDAYIQCVPRRNGPYAHEKICPSQLYFDTRLLTCNWQSRDLYPKGCKSNSKNNVPLLTVTLLGLMTMMIMMMMILM
ncbi:hypothetical protein Ahia01_000675600 [Argonauta hians]